MERALDKLNAVPATKDLASLNEQVDSGRRLAEDVAGSCLESKQLIPAEG
ncbi:hypothetical protein [Streptomyces sp. NPDC055287]